MKAFAAFSTAALTAGAAITKSAVEHYADYEQLVGGVETLFGAGGQSLGEYAKSVGKTTTDCSIACDKTVCFCASSSVFFGSNFKREFMPFSSPCRLFDSEFTFESA